MLFAHSRHQSCTNSLRDASHRPVPLDPKSPRSGLPVGKDSLVGLQAKRRWGPPAIQVPDPACRSERTHWWDSKRSEDGARQQSKSPIRLAGRKGLTGGTPSEAKMGPASNPSPRSGLPVGKDSLVGLQAKRRWGPPAIHVRLHNCASSQEMCAQSTCLCTVCVQTHT
jgi:hypothetical protein